MIRKLLLYPVEKVTDSIAHEAERCRDEVADSDDLFAKTVRMLANSALKGAEVVAKISGRNNQDDESVSMTPDQILHEFLEKQTKSDDQ